MGTKPMNLYEELTRNLDPNQRSLLRRVLRANDPRPATPEWKRNVRRRQAPKVKLRACDGCGKRRGVGRHHEWNGRAPHNPPPVKAILCKDCHALADGGMHPVWCVCGKLCKSRASWKRHRKTCEALVNTIVEIRGEEGNEIASRPDRIVSNW